VFSFFVNELGDYSVCSEDSIPSDFLLASDELCSNGPAGICSPTSTCIVQTLSTGTHFIYWIAPSPEQCDFASVSVTPLGGPPPDAGFPTTR
jgi:hypothetical protein